MARNGVSVGTNCIVGSGPPCATKPSCTSVLWRIVLQSWKVTTAPPHAVSCGVEPTLFLQAKSEFEKIVSKDFTWFPKWPPMFVVFIVFCLFVLLLLFGNLNVLVLKTIVWVCVYLLFLLILISVAVTWEACFNCLVLFLLSDMVLIKYE